MSTGMADQANSKTKMADSTGESAILIAGSPCATLFITVLFLPQLTEGLQYQRVIKERAVPAIRKRHQYTFPWTIGRHKGLVSTKPGQRSTIAMPLYHLPHRLPLRRYRCPWPILPGSRKWQTQVGGTPG